MDVEVCLALRCRLLRASKNDHLAFCLCGLQLSPQATDPFSILRLDKWIECGDGRRRGRGWTQTYSYCRRRALESSLARGNSVRPHIEHTHTTLSTSIEVEHTRARAPPLRTASSTDQPGRGSDAVADSTCRLALQQQQTPLHQLARAARRPHRRSPCAPLLRPRQTTSR